MERIEGKKVVLINGDQLADFMIDHGLGVTTTKTDEIREVPPGMRTSSRKRGAEPSCSLEFCTAVAKSCGWMHQNTSDVTSGTESLIRSRVASV